MASGQDGTCRDLTGEGSKETGIRNELLCYRDPAFRHPVFPTKEPRFYYGSTPLMASSIFRIDPWSGGHGLVIRSFRDR